MKNRKSIRHEDMLKICNVAGQLVRTLELGHKEVDCYISKDKAAYGDGGSGNGDKNLRPVQWTGPHIK